MERVLFIGARLLLGGIFVYASIDKIMQPAAFAEAVYNYQILPNALINPTAVFLPWLELFLGFFLILAIWVPGAALWGSVLMTVFFGALLFNLARGLDIHCGCFSTSVSDSEAPMIWYVLRDGAFLALAWYVFYASAWSKGVNRYAKIRH